MTRRVGYIHGSKLDSFSPPRFGEGAAGFRGYAHHYRKGAPLIGITASPNEDAGSVGRHASGSSWRVNLNYVDGVAQAGGLPVILPPIVGAAEEVVHSIDGLVLSGGSDLHPSYYGEEALPELDVTLPERDAFEMELLEHALERGTPVFGICRGLQVLNVALGGTLYQDLPAEVGAWATAHRQRAPLWQWTHEVDVDRASNLAKIMEGTRLRVNSFHHQAIKDLAAPLIAVAHATDGVLEAVESRDLTEHWLAGVQWHPEAIRGADRSEHRHLFEAHVAASKRHASCWVSRKRVALFPWALRATVRRVSTARHRDPVQTRTAVCYVFEPERLGPFDGPSEVGRGRRRGWPQACLTPFGPVG